jgi:signal transduction histidine kinase
MDRLRLAIERFRANDLKPNRGDLLGVRTTRARAALSANRRRTVAAVERHRSAEATQEAASEQSLAMRRLNSLLELQSARVACVLHDEASQTLAFAHMAIEDIAGEVPPPVQARLREVRGHLHAVAEQLRTISHELHPSILDDIGAINSIKFISRALTYRTGVQITIDVDLDEPCPAKVGEVMYRFVQEALANIGEHARAASASIAIRRERSQLVCVVCDDGAGFDVAATLARKAHHGLGLMLIRGRLEAVGGALDITSAPQQGTRLRAVIPLEI